MDKLDFEELYKILEELKQQKEIKIQINKFIELGLYYAKH